LFRAQRLWESVGLPELHAASRGSDEAGAKGLGELPCGEGLLVTQAGDQPCDDVGGTATAPL
jgi:hypothetical protein